VRLWLGHCTAVCVLKFVYANLHVRFVYNIGYVYIAAGLAAEWNRAQVRDEKRRPAGKLRHKYRMYLRIIYYMLRVC